MRIIHKIVGFNQQVLGIQQRKPSILPQNEHEISVKSLNEEVDEYIEAYDMCCVDDNAVDKEFEIPYLVKMTDAIVDNIYFAVGVLYKMGLTADQIERCINAVHECNIEKKLGTNDKRATGAADAVKPEWWVGPEKRIEQIIRERV